MKKNRIYFVISACPPLTLLVLLFAGNMAAAQQQRQIQATLFTNNACGNYPEKGNFLESRDTLNAGGNGCITIIKPGSGSVFFKGKDKVILGPGFHTEAGSVFVAYVQTDSAIQSLIEEQLIKTNIEENSISNLPRKLSPNRALIHQNSPNPFNNNTVISYTVPRQFLSAKIVVGDATGRILRQINVPAQGAGTLNLSAAALTPGIYNYSLWVDGQLINTKKMIIIK